MQWIINNFSKIFNTEPISAKAPSFTLEYKLIQVSKVEGTGFALLCQAQAFPIPLIR